MQDEKKYVVCHKRHYDRGDPKWLSMDNGQIRWEPSKYGEHVTRLSKKDAEITVEQLKPSYPSFDLFAVEMQEEKAVA